MKKDELTVGSWQLAEARVVTALLAVLIVLGCAVLWVGIPPGMFWLAGEVTGSSEGFLFFVLGGTPLAMVAWGWLLYRVNSVYERMRGGPPPAVQRSAWLVASSEERAKLRRKRQPRMLIDVAMTASATVALVLLLVWFFFFASMHLAPMQ